MTRIDGSSMRPRLPLTPKKKIEVEIEGKPEPPKLEDGEPSMRIAGFDRAHRLTRGTESRPWGDGHRDPDGSGPRERVSGPPDPVIPGKKGDHAGLDANITPDPTYLPEPESDPNPIDAGEGVPREASGKDDDD
jgi:hypothetical protein